MAIDWITPVTGLLGVIVGGGIAARSTAQQSRLQARAEAISKFEDIRPLWSQVEHPTSDDFTRLDVAHRSLSKLLLVAGVPVSVTNEYRYGSRNYLGWVAESGDMPLEVNRYIFALDRLIIGYLQRPHWAALQRRSPRLIRQRNRARAFAGHSPAL